MAYVSTYKRQAAHLLPHPLQVLETNQAGGSEAEICTATQRYGYGLIPSVTLKASGVIPKRDSEFLFSCTEDQRAGCAQLDKR